MEENIKTDSRGLAVPKGLDGLKGLNQRPVPTGNAVDDFIAQKRYALQRGMSPEAVSSQYKANAVENNGLKALNSGYGDSIWDTGADEGQLDRLNDLRNDRQPWYSKVINGIGKGIVLTGTTFIDGTIGLLNGIGQGIYNLTDDDKNTGFLDGLWNNATSNTMKDITNETEKLMPNYYSQYEREHPWAASSIFNANFLGDKFLKNLGFTVGAFYSGAAWVKLLKLPALLEAAKASQTTSQIVQGGVGSFISALNEGRTEALNNSTDWANLRNKKADDEYHATIQKLAETYNIEFPEFKKAKAAIDAQYAKLKKSIADNAVDMGNGDLLMNLPILTLSNMIQFGKLYSHGAENARRILSGIRGSEKAGYTAATSGALKKATIAASKGFISEGSEEMAQYMASDISGKYQDIDVDNYMKSKYDTSTFENILNFVKSFASGSKDALTDPNAWQEFFIGGLTGFMGMPMFRSARAEDGSFRSPITLQENVFDRYKKLTEKDKKRTEMADYMNSRLPKIQPYLEGLTRHMAYQNAQDVALQNDDTFSYDNAATSQLITDVEMWDNAGKLDDYKRVVKASSTNLSDQDIDDILKFTTKSNLNEEQKAQIKNNEALIDSKQQELKEYAEKKKELLDQTMNPNPAISTPALQEFNEILAKEEQANTDLNAYISQNDKFKEDHPERFGPFINNASQKNMSKEEVREIVENNGQQVLKAIDNYVKSKEYFNERVGNHATKEQIAELVWMQNKISDWRDRINTKKKDSQPILNFLVTCLDDKVKEKEDQLKAVGEKDKAAAALLENELRIAKDNKDFFETIKTADESTLPIVLSHIFNAKDNSEVTQSIKDTVDYYTQNWMLGLDEADKLKDFFDTTEKSTKAISLYNQKLHEAINDPVAQAKRLEKIKQAAANAEIKEKTSNLKEQINKAQTVQEIRNLIKGQPIEIVDKALKELEKDNDDVKEVQKIRTMQRIVNQELDKHSFDNDTEKDDTKRILNDRFNNAKNSDEVFTNTDRDINLDEKGENTPEEALNRINKARVHASTIMAVATSKMKQMAAFRAPVDTTEAVETEAKGTKKTEETFTAPSKEDTTNNNGITVTNITTAQPVSMQSAPTEVSHEEASKSNEQLNDAIEKSQENSKNMTTQEYIKPIIPEIHISAAKEGDFRPFSVVVKEREGRDFPIYEYLKDKGAFEYINQGKLKAGESIYFTVDKVAGQLTIFMTTKDGQIIGSLPTSPIKLAQVPGLTELSNSILNQYKEHQKTQSSTSTTENTSTENTSEVTQDKKEDKKEDEKFQAKEVSRVDKIMNGKIPYSKEERSIKEIIGESNPNDMVFAIVKNGSFATNIESIKAENILMPANMSSRNGSAFMLVKTGSGKYFPVALFTKHFNAKEINLNDVTNNSQYLKDFKEAITQLAYAEDSDDVKTAVDKLSNFIHLGGININFSVNKRGDKFITFGKPRLDSHGNFLRVNGKIQNEEVSIIYAKAPKAFISITRTNESTVNPEEVVDKKQIFNNIVKVLMGYNLPMQISADRVNKGTYNSYITDSDVLTSNVTKFSTVNNWFTADPIVNGERIPAKSPEAKIFSTREQFLNSTLGKSSTEYTFNDRTFYYRNGHYYDADGKMLTQVPEELFTAVWARNAFGDYQDVPYRKKGNIVLCNDNRVFDISSNTFLEGQEADEKRKEITKKEVANNPSASILNQIEKSQERVLKDRTDEHYYYITDENGEVQMYSRVHSEIDKLFGESFDNTKNIFAKKRLLFDKISKATANNWKDVVRAVQKEYPKEAEQFANLLDGDTSKITSLHKELENLIIQVENSQPSSYSKRALVTGANIDSIVRGYFNGDVITKPDGISQAAFNSILKALEEIRTTINANGETFYANNIVLYGTYTTDKGGVKKVAGEVDILAVDKEGNFKIYDIKSSSRKTVASRSAKDNIVYDNFKNTKILPNGKTEVIDTRYKRSYYNQYTLQLSFYQSLFEGMFKTPVKSLGIMPFHVTYYQGSDEVQHIEREPGITLNYNSTVPIFNTTLVEDKEPAKTEVPETEIPEIENSETEKMEKPEKSEETEETKETKETTEPPKGKTTTKIINTGVQPSLRKDLKATEVKTYNWNNSGLAPKSTTVVYEKDGKLYKGNGYLTGTINAGDIYLVIESTDKPDTSGKLSPKKGDPLYPNGAKSILLVLPNGRTIELAKDADLLTASSFDQLISFGNLKDTQTSAKLGGKTIKVASEEATLLNSVTESENSSKKEVNLNPSAKEESNGLESLLPPAPIHIDPPKPAEAAEGTSEKGEIKNTPESILPPIAGEKAPSDSIPETKKEAPATDVMPDLSFLNADTGNFDPSFLDPDNVDVMTRAERAELGIKEGDESDVVFREDRYRQEEYTQEMKDILSKAPRDSQGRLLAPNGKPSNLTERQYAQVRTKAFKEWFGDWENNPENASKVVDENVEPLVVYHGTVGNKYIKPFNTFDLAKARYGVYGTGFYFGNKERAQRFNRGRIIEAFLNIKNPAIGSERNTKEDGFIKSDQIVVFNPNQIKSATGNTGAFSTTNDDIRYREVTDEKAKLWDKEAEIKWLNTVLPQLSEDDRVKFVDGFLQAAGGGIKAWGQFVDGVMTLSNKAAEGTTYHEAFHAVFHLMLNQQEKAAILKEAAKMYGEKDNIALEELLAESFREYVMTENNKGILSKVLNFFKSLFIKTKYWNQANPDIRGLYSAIQHGNFADIKLDKKNTNKDGTVKSLESQRDFFDELAKKKPKITFEGLNEETKSLLLKKGWTRELFQLVSEKEREIAVKCAGI